MMIICLEQEYLDDNNVDVFSVLSQCVQLCHLLMMFIQDVKLWMVCIAAFFQHHEQSSHLGVFDILFPVLNLPHLGED